MPLPLLTFFKEA